MVDLGYSRDYTECYRFDFNNGNWFELPFKNAASFHSNLRDVVIRAQEYLNRNDRQREGREIQRDFGYGTITYSPQPLTFGSALEVTINCKDGHWAVVPVEEAKELLRLLGNQGF